MFTVCIDIFLLYVCKDEIFQYSQLQHFEFEQLIKNLIGKSNQRQEVLKLV